MGNNGRFSDGFLMGAVVGGALVFLVGTEKGNKVLKLLMEEGRAGLNDLMDEIADYKEEAREVSEAVDEEIEDELEEAVADSAEPRESSHVSKSKPTSSSSKRFFRKTK